MTESSIAMSECGSPGSQEQQGAGSHRMRLLHRCKVNLSADALDHDLPGGGMFGNLFSLGQY